jgi:hypothetical protein
VGGDHCAPRVRILNVSILIGIVSVENYKIVIERDGKGSSLGVFTVRVEKEAEGQA